MRKKVYQNEGSKDVQEERQTVEGSFGNKGKTEGKYCKALEGNRSTHNYLVLIITTVVRINAYKFNKTSSNQTDTEIFMRKNYH